MPYHSDPLCCFEVEEKVLFHFDRACCFEVAGRVVETDLGEGAGCCWSKEAQSENTRLPPGHSREGGSHRRKRWEAVMCRAMAREIG